MLAEKNKYIASAYKQLQVVSQDKQKRLEYEARQKAILDHNQMMLEAKQRGREQGREQGRKQGIEQGATLINKLNAVLIKDKRYDDLERSVNDKEFQQQLMSEYDIQN